ncbi:tyrosine-type recombinase/integrase [Parabacteroides sp.]
MATVKLYLDTRRARKDGTFPIKIMVNHKGNFLIRTEFYANNTDWDGSLYTTKANNYRSRNMQLRNIINKIENLIFELENDNRLNSMQNTKLKELIEDKLSGRTDNMKFLDYLDKFLETKTKVGTKKVYISTRLKIEEYDPKATFSTITPEWLTNFENWLKNKGGGINYIGIQLRNIRAVFNYAINNEYTTAYPFRKFKIKTEKTAKRAMKPDDIIRLRDYPCEPHQVKYRDMFMLIFYLIGINPVDLFQLKNINDDRIDYIRAKTGKRYSIKVYPEAMEIIEKYKGNDYLIDILDTWGKYEDFTHRMNINLKQIGEVKRVGLGEKKIRTPLFPNITIYHARHSWATIAAYLDIPKDTIAAALGHEMGSETTAIYIDFDQQKVDQANRKVLDFMKEVSEWIKFIDALQNIF